jgi:hypothetical protein
MMYNIRREENTNLNPQVWYIYKDGVKLAITNEDFAKEFMSVVEFVEGVVKNCEECEDGLIDYQPSGIDGYLPTGDANFETVPCWNCSEARKALKLEVPVE